jgi:hypothetical protein
MAKTKTIVVNTRDTTLIAFYDVSGEERLIVERLPVIAWRLSTYTDEDDADDDYVYCTPITYESYGSVWCLFDVDPETSEESYVFVDDCTCVTHEDAYRHAQELLKKKK